MSGIGSRTGWAAVLLALGLGTGSAAGAPGNSWGTPGQWWEDTPTASWRPSDSLDLNATALTGPDRPTVSDDAFALARSGRSEATVDSTASSSADCDGCSADSTLVHVVYLDRPTETTLDNISAAWATCRDCRATAVAVQVIVLRTPQSVRANNRALAANVGCALCRTAAAAFQLVVVGDRLERLSRAQIDELRRWAAEQAASLREPSSTAASPVSDEGRAGAALDQLEALVSEELAGSVTVDRDADMQIAEPGSLSDPATPAPGSVAARPGTPMTQA